MYANWPGRCHDARIFRNSPLCEKFETGEYRGICLADSGYPCNNFVITPKLAERTARDRRYNAVHKRVRSGVERAIGHWKRRFNCLHNEIRLEPKKTCKVVDACSVLYNMAKRWNTPPAREGQDIVLSDDEDEDEEDQEGRQRGDALREILIGRYF